MIWGTEVPKRDDNPDSARGVSREPAWCAICASTYVLLGLGAQRVPITRGSDFELYNTKLQSRRTPLAARGRLWLVVSRGVAWPALEF